MDSWAASSVDATGAVHEGRQHCTGQWNVTGRRAALHAAPLLLLLLPPGGRGKVAPAAAAEVERGQAVRDSTPGGRTAGGPQPRAAAAAAPLPASEALDVASWQRVRGPNFAIRVPPGFEDIMPQEPEDDRPQSTLRMEDGSKQSPIIAQFASSDRRELITLVVRPTTAVQLSFFEIRDVTDFGGIQEAAKVFLPPGTKPLATRQFTATPDQVPRTYYLYEFVANGKHVALSASVAKGKVYVLGAAADESAWRPAAGRLRAAAGAFSLVV